MHWDKTNKELTLFKMVIFFVCFVPVGLLCSNMVVFVPSDCKLQRANSASEKIIILSKQFLNSLTILK